MTDDTKKGFDFTTLVFGKKEERKQSQYTGGLQVIGAGYGRTGTTSLKQSFEILYDNSPCYHMSVVIENDFVNFWRDLQDKKLSNEEIRAHFKHFASTTDNPACVHWAELLAAHPNALVVLSVRDSDAWHKSVTDTIFNFQPGHPNMPFGIKIVQLVLPFWRRWAVMIDRNLGRRFSVCTVQQSL